MVDSKKRPGKDLDRIDRNILNELQKDGRISNVELSKTSRAFADTLP
ncbi:leucine-responsive regulatory protein [Salmonella enterica subsp. enterica]|nr:leucine-responsive regulatory protein [Salmonella enterica subsp. enterica]